MHEVIGRGRTAEVFRNDERSVLKLFRSDADESVVRREYECALFAWSNKVTTPKPEALVNREERLGIVYELVKGQSLLSQVSKNPLSLKATAKEMATLHYSMHQVPASVALPKQKAAITQAIQNAPRISEEQKKDVLRYLESLPEGAMLCHGDFHPDNILKDSNAFIIDWMTGCAGNPLCDVARSVLLLETSEIPDSVSFAMRYLLRFGQRKLARAYLASYCALSGTSERDIRRWLLPLYAARLVEDLSEGETRLILNRIQKETRIRGLLT